MYCITYIDRVNISVAAPLLRKELELSATQLGFVFSVFAYPYAAMQIVSGWLADKFIRARDATFVDVNQDEPWDAVLPGADSALLARLVRECNDSDRRLWHTATETG
jgi:MFS family permease